MGWILATLGGACAWSYVSYSEECSVSSPFYIYNILYIVVHFGS